MKHDFSYDPTYGYTEASLREVGRPEEPADFAAFWRDTYRQARRVSLELSHRPVASRFDGVDLFEVEFNALGGVRIGGWVSVPKNQTVRRGVVVGHGYGGRAEADPHIPGPAAAAIYPCARGFNRSAHSEIPSTADKHVLHGIESRDTYVHRGCAADLWASASALIELFPQTAPCFDYMGGSFGGGIGALALPWEHRFRKAFLDVPSFGNHPLRVQLECCGSGESVRRYREIHPEVMQVLQYFDSVTAARHIRIPVLVAAARFDPAVPPPGQFAVYNAQPCPKELFIRAAAHFEHPTAAAEDRRLFERLERWFA